MSFDYFMGSSVITKVLFAGAVIFVSGDLLATLFTIIYQRFWYFKVIRPKYEKKFSPACSLIVPCKGISKDLKRNLKAFLELDYPDYETVFVVESENDEAVSVIRDVIADKKNAKLAVAGISVSCAQKNKNLLEAIKKTNGAQVYVFADSDIGPDRNWLYELILPLADEKITVTSGFRWLHIKKGNAGELTHSYVNIFMYILFSVACYFGGVGLWGGSMAIRRKDYEELGVAKKWSKAAVDDMSLSQLVLKNSKKAIVVPPCITHTDDLLQTVRSTIAWFERQIMYLKAYQKALWLFLALPVALLVLILLTLLPYSIAVSVFGKQTFLNAGGGAALIFYFGELLTVSLYPFLGKMGRFPKFLILQPMMRYTHIISYLKTFLTNTITWAGIKYRINFRGEVAGIERP